MTRRWVTWLSVIVSGLALFVSLEARSSVTAQADINKASQVSVAELSDNIEALDERLDTAASAAMDSARQAIDAYADTKASATNAAINEAAYEALELYRSELSRLRVEIDVAEESLAVAARELNGRAPFVSFDAAFEESRSLAGVSQSGRPASQLTTWPSQPVVQFQTSVGGLGFTPRDFTFEWVPSTGEAAWFRVGKAATTENGELIRAFIDQALSIKRAEGYVVATNRTLQTDYGEAVETLLTNGDLYFRTWFEFERVQGTYDRHSLQYTYYVESGVESRRARAQEERYTQILGH